MQPSMRKAIHSRSGALAVLLSTCLASACGSDDTKPAPNDEGGATAGASNTTGGEGGGPTGGEQNDNNGAGGETNGSGPVGCFDAEKPFSKQAAARVEAIDPTEVGLEAGPDGLLYGDDKGIYSLPVGASTAVRLTADPGGWGFSLGSTYLYLMDGDGRLGRVPYDAKDAAVEILRTDIPQSQGRPSKIGEEHFFIELDGKTVVYPFSGEAPFTLATNEGFQDGQELNGEFYYTSFNFERPMRVKIDATSAPVPLSAGDDTFGDFVGSIKTDGKYVYWATNNDIKRAKLGDPSSVELVASPPGGSFGSDRIYHLEIIGDRVYFEIGDKIGWTAADGSSCGLVMTGVNDLGSDYSAWWSRAGIWVETDGELWYQKL